MYDAVRMWHPAQDWKPGPVMYDIFPILHILHPGGFYGMEEMKISIGTSGEAATPGITTRDPDGIAVSVATGIGAEKIKTEFFKTLDCSAETPRTRHQA